MKKTERNEIYKFRIWDLIEAKHPHLKGAEKGAANKAEMEILAQKAGIQYPTMYKIASAKLGDARDMKTTILVRVARHFNVEVKDILNFDITMPPQSRQIEIAGAA